ncbi:hypothetical protein GCM10007853_19500 [Algimonas ampicilliniresistens]|jgi:uncharacterized membrane protein YeaQ/YmgE (transglycosylase-associated protein family)|uniref:GlsB/YeaQ/YmgE family stress response membrane protein n=1 Tax=Algimonas ampicilliniresistens TaxID=1298735 RepID=A0ABQ5V948_9PROT|nr:GlsB/YeaQ/YmgE family stress response membrane protein [Algimonas ampicilliniresistens]GLQ24076.1 hypothetical protein GCM10007853_19500 [Algimonas ampicilliniresistens]
MALIIWLIIGGLAGWAAGSVMKAARPYGLIGDVILGILGAIAGGWLFGLLGLSASGLIGSFVTAFIGAMILIWLVRAIKKS